MPTSGLCIKSPCISFALKKKICKRMRVVVKDNWEMLSDPGTRINPDWRSYQGDIDFKYIFGNHLFTCNIWAFLKVN